LSLVADDLSSWFDDFLVFYNSDSGWNKSVHGVLVW
jgi:hypothetical protein